MPGRMLGPVGAHAPPGGGTYAAPGGMFIGVVNMPPGALGVSGESEPGVGITG